MIIDCISDLHGHCPKLEGGDLLIVAGDLTAHDEKDEYNKFVTWLTHQCYKKKIVVAGNHDNQIQKQPFCWENYSDCCYLFDSATEFEGLKIWGSPWTRSFEGMNPHCKAFTFDTEEHLGEKWDLIPSDVDILITHSPPFTILDMTTDGRQVGSSHLVAAHISRLNPILWVWGHIHEAYGKDGPYHWNRTNYVNACHVNEKYQPVNKPVRIAF